MVTLGIHNIVYDFTLKVTICRLYNILLVIQYKRGLYKGMNTRKQESLGPILDVDYHSILLITYISFI